MNRCLFRHSGSHKTILYMIRILDHPIPKLDPNVALLNLWCRWDFWTLTKLCQLVRLSHTFWWERTGTSASQEALWRRYLGILQGFSEKSLQTREGFLKKEREAFYEMQRGFGKTESSRWKIEIFFIWKREEAFGFQKREVCDFRR